MWVLLSLVSGQTALSQTRIANAVNNNERVVVRGTTPALIAKSTDTGRMTAGQNLGRMILQLAPSAEQDQKAAKFVAALHDPSSPSYHKWLTPAQFGQLYGVSDYDAAQVQHWLQGRGLTVHEVSQSHRFIVFSGTVSQVEDAFATQMHTYSYKNAAFIANSTDIQIPAALQPVVKGVVRLHSDPHQPNAFMGGKVYFKKSPGLFSFSDGSHYLTPADFAKIYNLQPLYDAGIDGTGQTIAIVGRSNIDPQDISAFRSLLGLPANDPQVIVNGDDPGMTFDDLPEATLDVTWSGAVAPMATIKFVVSQSNFADGVDVSAAYIVDHNLAPVMSTSYGSCEQNMGTVATAFYNSLWQQAAAEGITSFVSAGDNGGAGCDSPGAGVYATGLAVNGIASTPYNVAVGGTQFDDTDNPSAYWSDTNDPTTGASALGYIPEKVWNESSADPNYPLLWSAGGGVSTLYAKPDWQSAPGVPNDGMRDLPDFSLTAAGHDGYLLCLYRNCDFGPYFYSFGGTSASSPAAAGIMALVNQKLGGQPQGMANYVFYRLATTPGVYHDTIKGDNKVPDQYGQDTIGYDAGTGYDQATGLGSLDANALVNNWQAASAALGSTITLKLSPGQVFPVVHGTPITFNAVVRCTGTGCSVPTGTISLTATSSTGSDSIVVGTSHLTPGATASSTTIKTEKVPGGTYNVTARYSGDGTYYSSASTPLQVTVTPENSQMFVGVIGGGSFNVTPATVSYDEPLFLGFVVAGNSGFGYPSGTVSLLADGQPMTTVLADTQTISPMILNYGENSTLLSGTNAPLSQSSTLSYLRAGALPVGSHQLVGNYPGDNSFSSTTSNTYGFTVTKANSVIADFFPYNTPIANVPVMVGGQVALYNYCAPFGGTITVTDVTSVPAVVVGSGTLDTLYCDSYSFLVTFRASGTRIVRVDYSGDGNVNPSFATYTAFPVYDNTSSSTTLSADVPNAIAGSAVTLTAVVSADVPTHMPTGTVTFLDGSATLGTATLDATGTAVLVTNTLAGGQHNLTASYPGDGIITASVSNPITEAISDYVFQALPATLNIPSGQSGTATLNLIPLGGFAQTVQFSCGTLPTNVTCSFSPSSVTPDGVNPSTTTLTIKTGAALMSRAGSSALWSVSATALLGGILLLPFGRRKRINGMLAALALMMLLLVGVGCGGGSTMQTGVTPQTFTLNVTSSGPAGSKTVPLVVNITK
jgi:subtilase family serine protease